MALHTRSLSMACLKASTNLCVGKCLTSVGKGCENGATKRMFSLTQRNGVPGSLLVVSQPRLQRVPRLAYGASSQPPVTSRQRIS